MVRLADDYRHSVVFLGWPEDATSNRLKPIGTGFFVDMDYGRYIVTAGHVADDFKAHRDDLDTIPFGIRLNDRDGNGRVDRIDSAQFQYHPQYPNVDVAIMEYEPPEWAEVAVVPTDVFLSDIKMESKDIGTGDIAYVVGLFWLMSGKQRNLPIVHTGHVAGFPAGELIPIKDSAPVLGYLVEANAIKGASGSPVFVRRTLVGEAKQIKDGATVSTWHHGAAFLLGVWVAAWNERAQIGAIGQEIPRGIGIVTPAVYILEVLHLPELRGRREQRREKEYQTQRS
jgi:Trypsin-like peptidase domain